MRPHLSAWLVLLLLVPTATVMSAPGPNANAKIVVHTSEHFFEHPCFQGGMICEEIDVTGRLYPVMSYVLVLLMDGYTNGSASSGVEGAQYGIDYNGAPQAGVDLLSFFDCGTAVATPNWPAAGTGIRLTFGCRNYEPGGPGTGVAFALGSFYLSSYSPDRLRIVPHPETGAVKVFDCAGVESNLYATAVPSPLGFAEFTPSGTTGGYNPCGLYTAVEAVTWSRIKALHER